LAAAKKNRGPSGWAAFAGIVLFISGSLNLIFGLAAAINESVVRVGQDGVLIWNADGWGWMHFGLGVLMVATAIGLFAVETWARIVAVVFATISAIGQIVLFPAFPLLSLVIIALDVAVIYNLTVKHGEQAA
jgi:hypothetical protein